MQAIDNPFPAQAVAVFGTELPRTVAFGYMRDALNPLKEYLERFPDQSCALALSGGHGSGKTHLLCWLSQSVRAWRHSRAMIAYAKPNDASPTNLYCQILTDWTRDDLLAVQREALTRLGARQASAVTATASAAKDILDYESLGRAVQDKTLDLNALHLLLKDELVSSTTTGGADTCRRVAAACGLLEDPVFGEAAFNWLRGEAIDGLPNEALRSGLFSGGGDSGDTAIFALETLAGMFRIAETPMILLIDQIENFLVDTEIAGKSSNLKKLVEQLGNQGAAIVMAGTPVGWERMPRDVGPRLTGRKPLPVGALTQDECRDLVESLASSTVSGASLSQDGIVAIHELSGSSPREVLRIAHQAFASSGGNLREWARPLLVQAANRAGTIEDRVQLVDMVVNQVAKEQGLGVAAQEPFQYQLQAGNECLLAIALVVAADAKIETQTARKLTAELSSLDRPTEWVLVVAIGYSSERVRTLLSDVVDLIVFEEATFKSELKERLAVARSSGPTVPPAAHDDVFQARIARLESMLGEIQVSREAAIGTSTVELATRVEAATRPEREAAEIRTRHQLAEGLDELSEARRDNSGAWERIITRRLLVANEINIKNNYFDHLGGLYLEAIELQDIGKFAQEYYEIEFSIQRLKSEILIALRKVLSQSYSNKALLNYKLYAAIFPSFIISFLSFLVITYSDYNRNMEDAYQKGFESRMTYIEFAMRSSDFLLVHLVLFSLISACVFFISGLWQRPEFRFRFISARLRKIRQRFESQEQHKS